MTPAADAEIRNRVMHELAALKGEPEECLLCKEGGEHMDEQVFGTDGKEFCITSGERVWTEEEAEEMTEEELKAAADGKATIPAPTWMKLTYLINKVIDSEIQTKKWADDLRAACAYPFNPARKASMKRRYEDCLEGVAKIAQEIQEWKP